MKTWEAFVTYPDETLHCFVSAENEMEAMQEALDAGQVTGTRRPSLT